MVDEEPFEELTDHIIARMNGPEVEAENSEAGAETQPRVSHKEVSVLLEKLQLYEAQRDE